MTDQERIRSMSPDREQPRETLDESVRTVYQVFDMLTEIERKKSPRRQDTEPDREREIWQGIVHTVNGRDSAIYRTRKIKFEEGKRGGTTLNGFERIRIDDFLANFAQIAGRKIEENFNTMDHKTRVASMERWLRQNGAIFALVNLIKKDKGIMRGFQSSLGILAEFPVKPAELKMALLEEAEKHGTDTRTDAQIRTDKEAENERRRQEYDEKARLVEEGFGDELVSLLKEHARLINHNSWGREGRTTSLSMEVDNPETRDGMIIYKNLDTGDLSLNYTSYFPEKRQKPNWLDLDKFRPQNRVRFEAMVRKNKELARIVSGSREIPEAAETALRQWRELADKYRLHAGIEACPNEFVDELEPAMEEISQGLETGRAEVARQEAAEKAAEDAAREKQMEIESRPRKVTIWAIDREKWVSRTEVDINPEWKTIKCKFEIEKHGGRDGYDYPEDKDHIQSVAKQLEKLDVRPGPYNYQPWEIKLGEGVPKELEVIINCYAPSHSEYRRLMQELGHNFDRATITSRDDNSVIASYNQPRPEQAPPSEPIKKPVPAFQIPEAPYKVEPEPAQKISETEKKGLFGQLEENEELLELLQGYEIPDGTSKKMRTKYQGPIKGAQNLTAKFERLKAKLAGEEGADADDKQAVQDVAAGISSAADQLASAFGERESRIATFEKAMARAEADEYYEMVEDKEKFRADVRHLIISGEITVDNLEEKVQALFEEL